MATPALYSVTSGLAGCYMPNSGPYLLTAGTRKQLGECIRAEIEAVGFPASTFGQADLRRRWGFIQSARSSSVAHFTIRHGDFEVAFHGLTQAEADAMEGEE